MKAGDYDISPAPDSLQNDGSQDTAAAVMVKRKCCSQFVSHEQDITLANLAMYDSQAVVPGTGKVIYFSHDESHTAQNTAFFSSIVNLLYYIFLLKRVYNEQQLMNVIKNQDFFQLIEKHSSHFNPNSRLVDDNLTDEDNDVVAVSTIIMLAAGF